MSRNNYLKSPLSGVKENNKILKVFRSIPLISAISTAFSAIEILGLLAHKSPPQAQQFAFAYNRIGINSLNDNKLLTTNTCDLVRCI